MILAEEYETEEGVYLKGAFTTITDSKKHQKAEREEKFKYCNPAQVDLF